MILNWHLIRSTVSGLSILAGFILVIIAWLGICSEACAKEHDYLLLGMPFEWTGLVYFLLLIASYVLSIKNPSFSFITGILLAIGIGSEVMFIFIQKYAIGSWCPVCLGIAASLSIAVILRTIDYIQELQSTIYNGKRQKITYVLKRALATLSAGVAGFIIAFFGVSKPTSTVPETKFEQQLAFGNESSPVEVYVFTSWICPACRKFEPSLEKMMPGILKKAKVVYVDYGMDDLTLNYLPYHLSFMINNKDKYLELRKILKDISSSTDKPNEEMIQSEIAKINAQYTEMNYSDVMLGIKYFKDTAENLEITHLPCLAIVNAKNNKKEKLTGSAITYEDVIKTINKLN